MLTTPRSLPNPAQAEARPCCAPAPFSLVDAAADVQKRRRGKSRVSALADRQFLSEFKALNGIAQFAAPAQQGVRSTVSKALSPSASLPSFIIKDPRHWRDATDEIKAHFAFNALRESGPITGFTAWLSVEIDAKARTAGAPLPWIHKRLRETLNKILGPSEWFASLEEGRRVSPRLHLDGKPRLHVHGVGAFGLLTRARRKDIRKALRIALGAWEGPAARFQIKFENVPDAGWASYITKCCWLARPGIRAILRGARPGSPWRLSFDGPVLTMTNGIRPRAKELHEDARRIVLEARQRAKAIPSSRTAPETPGAACESVGEAVQPTPKRPSAQCRSVAINLLDGPVLPVLGDRAQPITATRSRDPPGPVLGTSAGPDPPLAERRIRTGRAVRCLARRWQSRS